MYTTDEFVNKVNLYGALPDGRYEPEEIIGVAHDQLVSTLMPLIISLNEEYYVRSESEAVTAGVASYAIPYRSLGMTLRELKLIVSSEVRDLYRIGPEQLTQIQSGDPSSFYLEGMSIILHPTPNAVASTLKKSYFQTPAKPVLVASAALVTGVDRVTGVLTAACPTAWSTSNTFDLVSSRNGHESLALDLTASSVTGSAITFAPANVPAAIGVGDYVSLAGEAPYMQCPDLCYRFLVELTVCDLLRSMGAQVEADKSRETADRLMQGIVRTLSTRVVGAPRPFTIDPNSLR